MKAADREKEAAIRRAIDSHMSKTSVFMEGTSAPSGAAMGALLWERNKGKRATA
jgi:hypothetical protein